MSDAEANRGVRKELKGTVVSDKAAKTLVVNVTRRIRHASYGKEITVSRKYHAHDEKGEAKMGDTVRIEECRPMSRLKRWRLVEVLARAQKTA
ncbi:MAG TPA: 30S ribosomal protein S17 [Kiritimatiellia bacterium]|nr:30S ribosomal protein S17 [Kiritimatiellia bacterium]